MCKLLRQNTDIFRFILANLAESFIVVCMLCTDEHSKGQLNYMYGFIFFNLRIILSGNFKLKILMLDTRTDCIEMNTHTVFLVFVSIYENLTGQDICHHLTK